MKVSLNWLQDFVTFQRLDPQNIARRLTEATAEVEVVEDQGACLHHCCVGKVIRTVKHPNADMLFLADVETDSGTKKVVCGGTNLKKDMLVAFAHAGARVYWHGGEEVELGAAVIRGEKSEGMICTAEELRLTSIFPDSKNRILIDLTGREECTVGASLQEALGVTDTILHVNNHAITHRPDLFSQVGFARECVALGLATWRKDRPQFERPSFPRNPLPFTIAVERDELMPRYCACVIEIQDLGKTPLWMMRRLEAVGFRSVNLPVDITNYVAVEVGVPLHSFDLDDIKGNVYMRTSKKGERIVTLDRGEHVLPSGALILSDSEGIFDLLGIMGGLRSSTKETTKRIYLHSASLDPVSIRRTVIELRHRTEAATVYEKGVPPITTEESFYRACTLFLELVPGALLTSRMESKGSNGHPKPIPLGRERLRSVLGIAPPEKNIKAILMNLGFTVKRGTRGNEYAVIPPLFRLQDIRREEDLIEEIGRIAGFDGIEPLMPSARIDPPKLCGVLKTLRALLKENGYIELLPLSLLGPKLLREVEHGSAECVELESPLSEDLSLLAPSTLPRLLEHAERNLEHVEEVLRTFTIANVFTKDSGEHRELRLLTARRKEGTLYEDPFLSTKRDVQHVLSTLGFQSVFVLARSISPYAYPGRVTDIVVNGECIGSVVEIHPHACEQFDLQKRAVTASMNLTKLLPLTRKEKVATPLPRFPAITYDLTIPMTQKKSLSTLLEKFRGSSTLLESIVVHDIFGSSSLGKGSYNLTLRCTYRSSERTLKEDEVKAEHEKLLRYTA